MVFETTHVRFLTFSLRFFNSKTRLFYIFLSWCIRFLEHWIKLFYSKLVHFLITANASIWSEWSSTPFAYCKSASLLKMISVQMCNSWHDIDWRRTSRSPSAIAEFLVKLWSPKPIFVTGEHKKLKLGKFILWQWGKLAEACHAVLLLTWRKSLGVVCLSLAQPDYY